MQSKKGIKALVLFALSACTNSSVDGIPMSSVASLDRQYSAQWTQNSFGATTPFVYRLYVGSSSQEGAQALLFAEKNEVLRTDEIVDSRITWEGATHVQISCLRGKVYHHSPQLKVGEKVITIGLKKECDQPVSDQWVTLQPFTLIQDIPSLVLGDSRFAKALRSDGKAIKGDVRVRVMFNQNEVREVVVLPLS